MIFIYMKNHKNFYIIVISLLIVFVMSLFGLYRCPSSYLFGIPCPTCGLTRALFSLLSFDIKKSFYYHALWPLFFIVLFLYVFYEFDIIRLSYKQRKLIFYFLVFIILTYYLIRIVCKSPITTFRFNESLIYKIYLYIK